MKTAQLSNAIARKYFAHANDECGHSGQKSAFFAGDGWGFWVRPDGTVDVDDISSNGELPSSRIVDACVRAAVKFLAK